MSVAMRSAKCVEENSRTKGNASTATSGVASSCNGRGWGRGGHLDVPRQDGGAVGDAERHSVGAQRCHENTETPITAAKPVGCGVKFSPARSAPCHRFILLNPTCGRRVRYIGKRNHIFSPWRQGDCTWFRGRGAGGFCKGSARSCSGAICRCRGRVATG